MLVDGQNFRKLHERWLLGCLIVSVVAIGCYLWSTGTDDRWPSGGSRVGLGLGISAGLIILFECAIVLRKTSWFRARRWIGSGKLWMKAHIWLGLLSVPLVFLHSGFRWGGPFTSLLMGYFCAVIVSGVVGLIIQNFLPRLLLNLVEGETIYSQIDNVSAQFVSEAARIVALTFRDGIAAEWLSSEKAHAVPFKVEPQIVGAQRKAGAIRDLSPMGSDEFPPVRSAEALDFAFKTDLHEFLKTGKNVSGKLLTRRKSEQYFAGLRQLVGVEANHAIDVLEDLCQRRREFNLQQRLHLILHGWLFIHLPLSLVLLVLLVTHIVIALRFG